MTPPFTDRRDTQLIQRQEVDTLRAIVCFVLVFHHMIGISPTYGLELAYDHPISILSHTTQDMRMPIFSFISGLVLARATGNWGKAPGLIGKKARRLLLPMLSVGTLFWLAKAMDGSNTMPLPMIYVTSFAHYWFLQASFVLMTAFFLLTCLSGGRDRLVAGGLIGLGFLWWGLALWPFPLTNWFSLVNAVFLLPFFMSGYLLSQTPTLRQTLRHHPLARPAGALLLIFGLWLGWGIAADTLTFDPTPRRLMAIFLGISACFGLLLLRPRVGWLARIGTYSYAIYLFHVFFTAAVTSSWRFVDEPLPLSMVIGLGMVLGMLGPMAVQKLLLRSPCTGLIFLGLPPGRIRARIGKP